MKPKPKLSIKPKLERSVIPSTSRRCSDDFALSDGLYSRVCINRALIKANITKCAIEKWQRFDSLKSIPKLDSADFHGFSQDDLNWLEDPYRWLEPLVAEQVDELSCAQLPERKKPRFWFELDENGNDVPAAKRLKEEEEEEKSRDRMAVKFDHFSVMVRNGRLQFSSTYLYMECKAIGYFCILMLTV